jgi:hypothetical protein
MRLTYGDTKRDFQPMQFNEVLVQQKIMVAHFEPP